MTTDQAVALMAILSLCFVIVKNAKRILKILVALTMAAALFGVYTIVGAVRSLDTNHSDVGPAGVQADHGDDAAHSPAPQAR